MQGVESTGHRLMANDPPCSEQKLDSSPAAVPNQSGNHATFPGLLRSLETPNQTGASMDSFHTSPMNESSFQHFLPAFPTHLANESEVFPNSDNSTSYIGNNQPNRGNLDSPSHACGQKVGEKPADGGPPIFSCTFCGQSFKSKYNWARHEKSLHLDLEAWTCAPESGITSIPATGENRCAYCLKSDPTPEHLETHNHSACSETERIFNRKDHLVQHLRLVHRLKEIPSLHTWQAQPPPFFCRCGFCDHNLTSWGERVDHLAGHFRDGATMWDWHGDHGFGPAIATKIRNSIPPSLIAGEWGKHSSNKMQP